MGTTLQSYLTKRGLMLDKELIQTPVSRPNACTVRAENTLQMLPGTNRSIRAASEGNTHTPSTLRCVTACSHSTSATRLQGKIDKMHQQHRYGQLQYIIYVCGIWGNSLFTALLRQFNLKCLVSSMWPHVQKQGQCQVKCVRAH